MTTTVLGAEFLRSGGIPAGEYEATGRADLIGVYVGASWCQPCAVFTPLLHDFYRQAREVEALFEVVFVSNDETEGEFLDHLRTMPWFATPFARRYDIIARLDVEGVPALLVLDGRTGAVVSKHGRDEIEKYGIRALDHWRELAASTATALAALPEPAYGETQQQQLYDDPASVFTVPRAPARPVGPRPMTKAQLQDCHDAFALFDIEQSGCVRAARCCCR